MTGKIYVFEGADACGKDTQAVLFANHLREKHGRQVLIAGYPTHEGIGEYFREEVLKKGAVTNKAAMFCLMMANMIDTKSEIFDKAISDDVDIVLTRSHLTSLVFQLDECGVMETAAFIRWLQAMVQYGHLIKPNFTFYLKISRETQLSRLGLRENLDIFESQEDKVQCKRIDLYNEIFKGDDEYYRTLLTGHIETIDASGDEISIHNEVLNRAGL